MSKPRVMIATPTPGLVKTSYMKAVIATKDDLAARGIDSDFDSFEGSDPVLQRNVLATRNHNSDFTHLYFVDSDMIPTADLCAALLNCNKPVIGTVATTRHIDFARIEEALEHGVPFRDAVLFGFDWIAYLPRDVSQIKIESGILEVTRHGFGACLIQRQVFETMIKTGAAKKQARSDERTGEFFNFFTPRAEAALDGQYISEDMSFCDRWRKDCGGEIVVLADTPIFHVGDFAYGGSYFKFLQAVNTLEKEQAAKQQPPLPAPSSSLSR